MTQKEKDEKVQEAECMYKELKVQAATKRCQMECAVKKAFRATREAQEMRLTLSMFMTMIHVPLGEEDRVQQNTAALLREKVDLAEEEEIRLEGDSNFAIIEAESASEKENYAQKHLERMRKLYA